MSAPLPAHVTASITNLVGLIHSGRTISDDHLTRALEGLVQAGISIAESRQGASHNAAVIHPGLEVRASAHKAIDDDDAPLPPNACGAVFTPPRAARSDPRYQAPCALDRDHLKRDPHSAHQNRKGVSWGTRSGRRMTTTEKRNTAMAPTKEALKARTERLARQMTVRTVPGGRVTSRDSRGPATPLDAAQRALELAKPPQWGWTRSERRVVLERLEQTATALLQHALDHRAGDLAQRREIEGLQRELVNVRSALVPGCTVEVRQASLDRFTAAVRSLLTPLQDQDRITRSVVRRLNAQAEVAGRPAPQPAAHPWLADRSIA
ncbi:hypothetical protein BU52_09965 [Streptomyces toyocaensis]|uniref:Uncharacterized protein n=1 Tax=Streptomyces toyocaensis TaxID=55952 RepID=A0A081XUV0_STRTO|nr:hypothetical protein [Streptomyces toyocaensis]KES07323.1 hypothetical protein BU52_09965 [Streptomyces toyocaensis]